MHRLAFVMCLGLLVAGCPGDPPDRRNLDTGADADAGSSDVGDIGLDDTSGDIADDGESGDASDGGDTGDVRRSDTGTAPEPVEDDQLCSAAGVSSGGGFTLTQCVGPAEPAGPTSSGGGMQLESGSLQVITP